MSYLDLFKFTPFKSGSGMCYPSSYYEASTQGCVGGAKKSKKLKTTKKLTNRKTTKKPKKKATRKTTKKRASKKKR